VTSTENAEPSTSLSVEGFRRVASIEQARKQAAKRRTAGLTDTERQLLLEEIAKVSAELCDLQIRAADIARRVAASASTRAERAWRRFHPLSFWFGVGFSARAVWLYLTWRHVASACKLTHKRRRWRLSLDTVPVLGAASRETTAIVERRHLRRLEVERAPRLGLIRPSRQGWRLPIRLPHWLIAGATQSGKSTLLNAIIRGLAPQPVALVGFDLKGGVS